MTIRQFKETEERLIVMAMRRDLAEMEKDYDEPVRKLSAAELLSRIKSDVIPLETFRTPKNTSYANKSMCRMQPRVSRKND